MYIYDSLLYDSTVIVLAQEHKGLGQCYEIAMESFPTWFAANHDAETNNMLFFPSTVCTSSHKHTEIWAGISIVPSPD